MHRQLFHFCQEADAVVGIHGRLDLDGAAIQRLRHIGAELGVDGGGHFASGLEIASAQAQVYGGALLQSGGNYPFYLCAIGNAAGTEVVDRDLAATSGCTGTRHNQVALCQRINFTVRALKGRGDQHAAL